MWRALFLSALVTCVLSKLDEDDSSGDQDLDDSIEKIGAMVAQVHNYPFSASLAKNGVYLCSAVILNTYWTLTLTKCFDSDIISSYVTHKNLKNFTIRAGSSYNNKAGNVYNINQLVSNFDLKVSAVKLENPMTFTSQIDSIKLPNVEDEPTFGYLAAIVAWTPTGHLRVVNAPVLEPTICEPNTKMFPGQYICLGGVQDPNRHFCRKDNGGAVIQNNTLIGISSFTNTCALYSKTHAFPRVASFTHWLNSIIWDEEDAPTTTELPTTTASSQKPAKGTEKATQNPESYSRYGDQSKFMLTLPFAPINVPLEPSEFNSVLPGMSLYEAYLQNMKRPKQTTFIPETTTQREKYKNIAELRRPRGFRHSPSKYTQYGYI